MKQAPLARLLQISVDALRRTSKEELLKLGWVKCGTGKGCYYKRSSKHTDTVMPEMDPDMDIKQINARAKLADAVGKELKNEDIKRTLIIKAAEIFRDSFITGFDEYAKTIYKLDIDKDSVEKLQDRFIKCQKLFSHELETRLQELFKPF